AEGHDPATGSRKSPRSPGCPVSSLQHQVVTPVTPARDAKGVVASPTPGAFMIAELIDGANNLIWSIPLIVGLLIVGLYFTIRTRLLQIRNLPRSEERRVGKECRSRRAAEPVRKKSGISQINGITHKDTEWTSSSKHKT